MKRQPGTPIRLVDFIDKAIKVNEAGKPFKLAPHQRVILDLINDHLDACTNFIYGTIKKSGKTTIQAAFHLWWGFTHPFDEILLAANDFDQSLGRVFKIMCALIRRNPALRNEVKVMADKIIFNNGTVSSVIAGDAPGEAGANQGDSGWDELHGFTSERSLRLWEELTPLANKPSVRFVSTYAGWENESKLLWDLYLQGVDKDEHPEGKAERIHPDLPIYVNREAGIFCYWDHEPRMPWQTPSYYERQKKTLRPGTYLRLHENRWVSAESTFITGDMWDLCVDANYSPLLFGAKSAHAGLDIGVKHDATGFSAVYWDPAAKIRVAFHKVWRPTNSAQVNLDSVKSFIIEMCERNHFAGILADPLQCLGMIQDLQAVGVPIKEFPQTIANTVLMGESLFTLVTDRNIVSYPSAELREHVTNAVGLETERGIRMIKGKASRKIDLAISLAMACVGAIQSGQGGSIDDVQSYGDRAFNPTCGWEEQGDHEGSQMDAILDGGRSKWDW